MKACSAWTIAICLLFTHLLFAATGSAGQAPRGAHPLPIVFVHGNGDDAARWVPTMWLFESNGYPADRLFAIRFHHPAARTADNEPQAFRSSTAEARAELSDFVDRVLRDTGSTQVMLVGSSRGGLTMRNYLANGKGRSTVAMAVLCGTPNHGVVVSPQNPEGEFNGSGTFLTALNRPAADGTETVPGVAMLTLRSDHDDKFAQPTGIASGRPGVSTGIGFDGPALKGASNEVLPGMDHRELAFSREAFARMFLFLTGHPPRTLQIVPQPRPKVSGVVTGFAAGVPTNDPVAAVHVRVFAVSSDGPAGTPVYETTTAEDGHWGPFTPEPNTEYAFDLQPGSEAPTAPPRHVRLFVAAFPRSTHVFNLRLLPAPVEAAPQQGSGVLVLRPEGYWSREHDPLQIDGRPAAQEPEGLPVRDAFVASGFTQGALLHLVFRTESMWVPASDDLQRNLSVAYFLW